MTTYTMADEAMFDFLNNIDWDADRGVAFSPSNDEMSTNMVRTTFDNENPVTTVCEATWISPPEPKQKDASPTVVTDDATAKILMDDERSSTSGSIAPNHGIPPKYCPKLIKLVSKKHQCRKCKLRMKPPKCAALSICDTMKKEINKHVEACKWCQSP